MGRPLTTELWLVRHGRTEWAAKGWHTGRTDVPLDDIGRAQAISLAAVLAPVAFDQVFTSPLARAKDTCALAGFADRAIDDDDLMEWDYGRSEGRTAVEIRTDHPGWILWDDGVIDGEGISDVAARADRFLRSRGRSAGRVLIFAHGHLLRILTARWLGLGPETGRLFVLEPAATSVLGYERDQAVIRTWNRVADIAPRAD